MPRIGSNLFSLNALHAMERHQRAIATAMERLATGRRINRASDDPAGAAAAASLDSRRVSLEEIIKQAQYGQNLLDSSEGALAQLQDLLTDLSGLVVQSASTGGGSPAEREAQQTEADSILQAIDYITKNTTFNGQHILTDATGFQSGDTWIAVPSLAGVDLGRIVTGIEEHERPDPTQPYVPPVVHTADLHDLASGGSLNLVSGDHELAQQSIKSAIQTVSGLRAQIGGLSRYTLGAQTDAAQVELENTAAAESRIVDTDYAAEMAELVRSQTLAQASLTVIQMAQRNEQRTLDLLR